MGLTILWIYILMSLIMMFTVEPWNDEEIPIIMTILCFLIGGAIFIMAILIATYELVERLRQNGQRK